MAGIRLNSMEIRQIIRLKKEGLSNRKVADLLRVSRNTVNGYIQLFEARNLNYEQLLALDDASLADLFPKSSEVEHYRFNVLAGYFTYFERELKKPGCTLLKLWEWYIQKHPDGYRHAQFNVHFNKWRTKIDGSCKLEHKAAERLFVDFTGKKLHLVDKQTGAIDEINVFVGILPASQYVFVRAVRTQSREDLMECLSTCLDYVEGVPRAIVSDNLKSAVSKGSKYAPQINKTLNDFALHYGCVIDPARP